MSYFDIFPNGDFNHKQRTQMDMTAAGVFIHLVRYSMVGKCQFQRTNSRCIAAWLFSPRTRRRGRVDKFGVKADLDERQDWHAQVMAKTVITSRKCLLCWPVCDDKISLRCCRCWCLSGTVGSFSTDKIIAGTHRIILLSFIIVIYRANQKLISAAELPTIMFLSGEVYVSGSSSGLIVVLDLEGVCVAAPLLCNLKESTQQYAHLTILYCTNSRFQLAL